MFYFLYTTYSRKDASNLVSAAGGAFSLQVTNQHKRKNINK